MNVCNSGRHNRLLERNSKRRKVAQAEPDSKQLNSDAVEPLSIQFESEPSPEVEIKRVKAELDETKLDLQIVRGKLSKASKDLEASRFDEAAFVDNDEKVLYYSGLPSWEVLLVLFTYLKNKFSTESRSLTQFQQLIIMLMRLQLNLPCQDLGCRFAVHKSTVSRTFYNTIGIMYTSLKPLIHWPQREVLKQTMPMDFRKHCLNCVVIIGCFEIFTERPSNLLARAQTYSSYKHHNTAKYLIGITPQGTVCTFLVVGEGE